MRELIHRAFEGKGSRRLAGTAEHGGRRDMLPQNVMLDLERRRRVHDQRVEAAWLKEVPLHGRGNRDPVADRLQFTAVIGLQCEVLARFRAKTPARWRFRSARGRDYVARWVGGGGGGGR